MVNHHLKTFIVAADSGSFIKAGEKLFITPNAVAKQINLLESHLHVKLFERTRRGLALTKEGEYVYKEALEMISRSEVVMDRLRNLGKSDSSTIRVGASLINSYHILHERWMRVADRAPNISIQIEPYRDDMKSFEEILAHLGEAIDVIPCLYDEKFYEGKCRILHLTDQKVQIGIPERHRMASKAYLNWEDLDGEPVIVGMPSVSTIARQIEMDIRKHCPDAIVEEADIIDYHLFNRAVQENKLLVTADCWRSANPLMVTRPMDWSYTFPYGIIYPMKPTPAVRRFVSLLAET